MKGVQDAMFSLPKPLQSVNHQQTPLVMQANPPSRIPRWMLKFSRWKGPPMKISIKRGWRPSKRGWPHLLLVKCGMSNQFLECGTTPSMVSFWYITNSLINGMDPRICVLWLYHPSNTSSKLAWNEGDPLYRLIINTLNWSPTKL